MRIPGARLLSDIFSSAGRRIPVPDWPVWTHNLDFGLTVKQLEQPEAYQLLPDVYAAVSLIQDAIAALPVRFYRVTADGQEEAIEDGADPVVDLFERANALDTGYETIHSLVGHFLINGNGALFLDYEGVMPGNASFAVNGNGRMLPSQIWALPSHLIKPVLSKGRKIEKYLFYNGQTQPIFIPTEQIVWIPDFHTDNNGVGMSRLLPLDLSIHTAYDMERFQREMFKRGGMTAGVYTTDQPLGPEERARVMESLKVEGEGPENYFKPVIMPRNLRFIRSGLSHSEMGFFDANEWNTQKIARVYKIPPSMLGMRIGGLGGSDKGLDADMMLFINHALMPTTRRIERKVNERLFKELFGMPDVRMRFDYSGQFALQNAFLQQAQAYLSATGRAILTVNEARKRMGMPPDQDPRADNLWAAEDAAAAAAMSKQIPVAASAPVGVDEILRTGADEKRDLMRAAADHELSRWVEFSSGKVKGILRRQRERVVRALLEGKRANSFSMDFLMDQVESPDDVAAARGMFRRIFSDVGAEAYGNVAVEASFSALSKRSSKWIREASFEMVKNISATTRDNLRATLAEGIGAGESQTALVARVNEVFRSRSARAATIARTESHAAMNAGRLEGWRQAEEKTGVSLKKTWLTSKDEHVRGTPDGTYKNSEFSHYHADGQTVPLDRPFFVGDRHKNNGESCMAPGDNSLSVGNRINCRCTMIVEVNDMPDVIENKSAPVETILRESDSVHE